MDPADLLDYALGRLDGPQRKGIEQQFLSDPVLAERVARVIRNLGRLLDDGQGQSPSERTLPTPSPPPRPNSDLPARSEDRDESWPLDTN